VLIGNRKQKSRSAENGEEAATKLPETTRQHRMFEREFLET